MKIFVVDFNRVITDQACGLTDAAALGYERLAPDTQGLRDGERIIVDMPGELWAEASATHRDDERGRYWYGELIGRVHYYDEDGAPAQQDQPNPRASYAS